jgi:hypothetical protein
LYLLPIYFSLISKAGMVPVPQACYSLVVADRHIMLLGTCMVWIFLLSAGCSTMPHSHAYL